MLFEGIKINMLPPEEREAAKKASKQMRKEYRKANRKDKAYRYGLFAGHQLGARVVAPRIIDALQTRHLVKSTLKRERKLDKKERESRMYEDSARKAGPLRRAGAWADNKARSVQNFALEHPGQFAVGSVLASVGSQALMGIGSHYMQHRAKMKIDPNYAAQTYHFARQKATRTGEFAPILPSQASNKPQKNIQPDNHTPAEEGRGNVPTNKKDPHKRENAHMAIMRQGTMDMDKINSIGLAGSKNYKVPTRTQTGTQKEDCMGVDAAVSMVDRLDEFDWAGTAAKVGKAVKDFAPQAKKAASGLKKEVKASWDRAKPHVTKAAGDIKTAWKRRNMAGDVGKKFRQNKTSSAWGNAKKAVSAFRGKRVSEVVLDYTDNIYEAVQAAVPLLAKAGTFVAKTVGKQAVKKAAVGMARDAAISYAGNKVMNRLNRPREEDITDIISDRAQDLCEVGYMKMAKVFARRGVRFGVEQAGGAVGTAVGTKLANIGTKKQPQTEEIGYGGKSEYEINPAKNYKAARALQSNTWYNSTISSRKTRARNLNKPKIPVNPQMNYGESVLEATVGNAVNNIGSTLDHYAGKAVKGAFKGAKKAGGGYVKWLGTGSKSTQVKKIAGSVAAAHLARKAWKARKGNKAYQEKRAAHHREKYNDASQNLDYAHARDDLRSRRRNW